MMGFSVESLKLLKDSLIFMTILSDWMTGLPSQLIREGINDWINIPGMVLDISQPCTHDWLYQHTRPDRSDSDPCPVWLGCSCTARARGRPWEGAPRSCLVAACGSFDDTRHLVVKLLWESHRPPTLSPLWGPPVSFRFRASHTVMFLHRGIWHVFACLRSSFSLSCLQIESVEKVHAMRSWWEAGATCNQEPLRARSPLFSILLTWCRLCQLDNPPGKVSPGVSEVGVG